MCGSTSELTELGTGYWVLTHSARERNLCPSAFGPFGRLLHLTSGELLGHLLLRFLELPAGRGASAGASALGRFDRGLLDTLIEKSMSVRPLVGLRLRALRLTLGDERAGAALSTLGRGLLQSLAGGCVGVALSRLE